MNRIQMDIFGLTDRGMSQGAFALILKEADGIRKMPIIIGVPEAQAIANELEGLHPQRPMTHDLLRMIIEGLGGSLREVVIHTLKESTFYASLIFDHSNLEIDARPSDAIAIAVRCGVPIYVTEEILDQAAIDQSDAESDDQHDGDADDDDGISDEDGQENPEPGNTQHYFERDSKKRNEPLTKKEQLEHDLDEAIRNEDYEYAARIRDELNRL